MIKDNQIGRDAFSRYLPQEETTQATQPSNHNEKQQSEKRHQATQVSDVSDRCQNVSDNGKANGSHRYTDVSDVSDNGQGSGGGLDLTSPVVDM
jgi:hypothetical protein